MENLLFSEQDRLFKINKLKKVIFSKLPDISEENVQEIIRFIDVNTQYYVKATRNPKRFLNMLTQENVCREDECFTSDCEVIYGHCSPGFFGDRFGERIMREGFMGKDFPAAAIKKVVDSRNGYSKSISYYLVIYEPMESSSQDVAIMR